MSYEFEIDSRNFDLGMTLDCGQCFRFFRREKSGWTGTVRNKTIMVNQIGDRLIFENITKDEFESFWRGYFDLDTDYAEINRLLYRVPQLRGAIDFAGGIRILRQEPWETLCSFIISQNNNIKRIKGIIQRLCGLCGERLPGGGFSFPSPAALSGLSVEDLAPLRSGFRARYILDAARRVHDGRVDLCALESLPTEQCYAELEKILGVGRKVADCVMVYGYHRLEALPRDVWVRRAMAELFPAGMPEEILPYAGVAGQYLFHWIRHKF
ncbi:MAG: DNA-3-methyladenine glycosylase 2 family protein [Oscillospiraceae bacterium]|nr:DNA-3-methyladenine glycosylase 2 family protein [Oscillospiraceae bacterium]